MKPRIITRHLASQRLGEAQLLDLVADTAAERVRYFFAKGTVRDVALAAVSKPVLAEAMIDGAPMLICADPEPGSTVSQTEPELFAGDNVTIATRNNEPAETVAAWLAYHHTRFGLTGAVIFERAQSGEEPGFWDEVDALLHKAGTAVQVVVVFSQVPLGAQHMPPESHPFCLSEAPGRDRMDVPPADRWRAPLAEMSIYEIARQRFLPRARAVANFDLHDLLQPHQAGSPFDMAAASPGVAVMLTGQHCYPWRVRKGQTPSFADHICVQFDKPLYRQRWCVAPATLPQGASLKCLQVSETARQPGGTFFRFMAIRHPINRISRIVPKSSLVEQDALLALAQDIFNASPVRVPAIDFSMPEQTKDNRTAIVTTMKNEGPFILEWLAYHRAIGVQDFLVYTNDCSDGTDRMFDLLQRKGLVQHRENPFRQVNLKPQHAALQAAEHEPLIQNADWIICMDVDEFINIKTGEGLLSDLYAAIGDANMISCTWRLFGNADIDSFCDKPTIAQFERCAEELSPKPHQAWGFKTLFRNTGIFKKLGVHRPKGLNPQLWDHVRWVNGSGQPMPKHEIRNAWRSTVETYGYDLVSLNHYAVRNCESFLVKRDRGRVNHVDRDQGLAYWFRMNNNATTDRSIQRHLPKMQRKLEKLLSDPEIAQQHHACVVAHEAKISELKQDPEQQAFYQELTGARMKKLSRMHRHFGANVFLSGPDAIPEEVVWTDHDERFFFTVEKAKTNH
ncbi:glycosyltransferase family 2 protein [Pontibaca sp. S1109L]|uniref:Glycosyltransferase family 2 protein n=2 Tax=Pontibaca salina TaxID=2795731 RepID=A0A934HRY7_9RHOB|nr:glycosyltransferase family 2 protein [Pontibaca salina]MBI6629460.1 glycosyltransferase family 2 protein [Pontibaca salina]